MYGQTAKFVYLRATVYENADLPVEINRRELVVNLLVWQLVAAVPTNCQLAD